MPKPKPSDDNEWKVEVLASAKAGPKHTWKAQRLTAPDGTVLLGFAKFTKKADGTEVRTQQKVNMPADEAHATLQALKELIEVLESAPAKKAKKAKAEPEAPAKKRKTVQF